MPRNHRDFDIPLEELFPHEYRHPRAPESGDITREIRDGWDWDDGAFGRLYETGFWYFMPPF